jgi:adenylate cyclase
LARVDQLNTRLRGDLHQPLRIGIGIHFGEAIVGAMGPPAATVISAIGESVNTCARLESLTKDYDCRIIVSRRAAEMAGLDVKGRELVRASVHGLAQPVEFYTINTMADLRGVMPAPFHIGRRPHAARTGDTTETSLKQSALAEGN